MAEVKQFKHLEHALRINVTKYTWLRLLSKVAILALLVGFNSSCARHSGDHSATTEFDKKVYLALDELFYEAPITIELSKQSKGILIFPYVTKVGLLFAGQFGKGAMIVDDEIDGYYKTSSASVGFFTFGSQSFGLAIFLMTDEALSSLQKTSTWDFGAGLKTVFGDMGIATNTVFDDDIYVFVFGQKGIMAELGSIEAMKIIRIDMD